MAAILAQLRRRAAAAAAPSPASPSASSSSSAPAAGAASAVGTAASSRAPPPEEGAHLRLPPAPLPAVSPPGAPQRCALVAEAVGAAHAAALLAAVDDASHAALWVELRGRRLQRWEAPLPPFLARLCEDLVAAGLFAPQRPPNSVLVNDYAAGEGIAPHADGPAYDALVCTLSLGAAPALLRYSVLFGREDAARGERGAQRVGALVLRPRSLVATSGALYERYAHGIPEGAAEPIDLAAEAAALAAAAGGGAAVGGGNGGAEPALWTGETGGLLPIEGRRVSITIRHRRAEGELELERERERERGEGGGEGGKGEGECGGGRA